MYRRSLSTTFVLLIVSASLVVTASLSWVVFGQATESRNQRQISTRLQQTMELNQQIRAHVDDQITLVYAYLDRRDRELADRFEELHLGITQQQIAYLRMPVDDRERLRVARIQELHDELALQGAGVMAAVGASVDDVIQRIARMETTRARLNGEFDELTRFQAIELDAALSHAEDARHESYLALLMTVGVMLLLVAWSAYTLRYHVQQPLSRLLAAARRIRSGDLGARAEGHGPDEIGRVAREFDFMAESLQESYTHLEERVRERTREIQELQDQLVASERMSAVGQLVSGVAHELNNPLTVILGMAKLAHADEAEETKAAEDTEGPSEGEDTALEMIIHEAERCRRIVQDLLQFVRQREAAPENISLDAVVDRTLRLRDYETDTHGVRVVRRRADAPTTVFADPYKLEQVTLILLNNAIDAIPAEDAGGTVTVSTRASEAAVTLVVEDTGPGIAEPDRVFEPFYTTKDVGEGTGLGLSVAFGIVSDHGGNITATNTGNGARFTVTLPRISDPGGGGDRADRDPPQDAAEPALTGRVLIVDDEGSVLRVQERVIERMGLEAKTARSGEDAIELLEGQSFDVVVCDLRMPGSVDGVGVYRWVREHRPHLASRFLFVTGDPTGLREAEQVAAGALEKPFDFAAYREKLRELLANREGP